jgi:cell division septation protein DedD
MAKNEEGDFELILGNRQLLSVFFIVVVLLGVFFTMGYIVGRNSPLTTAEATPAEKVDKKESKPMVVDSAGTREPPSKEPAKEAPPPVPTETAAQQPAESKPAAQAPAKPEPRKPEAVKTKPEPAKSAAVDRPSGTYLQLAATSQHEADIEVDVLRRKGFRAMSAEIPEKPGTFRVLVGPFPDSDTNKMRTDLQNAGFPGDRAIRRTL